MNAIDLSNHSGQSASERLSELCCSPLLASELAQDEAEFLAQALRTLGEPARLRILGRIRTRPRSRATTTELAAHLGLSQPTVSHHLGALHDMGFLRRERDGRRTWYSIEPAAFEALQQLLEPEPPLGVGASE
ncbi:metalloregulator ArsR/SmtB family transcription factor [Nostocoides sp. F2B08]|uniref:ArsR/SmtB family transcription factor n=1 Tax=Nostocoides sp. F2B08 TaxID=2653936 RepID=UPI001262BA12|nr:metalloregulator ArsR/SmtB family transcription factor [Tetrasphaera sp. F2B08]KAB7743806.1 metalloregulator ArsR/SmtB family transcription factor [Tetrasphaera sp. F2B08]